MTVIVIVVSGFTRRVMIGRGGTDQTVLVRFGYVFSRLT